MAIKMTTAKTTSEASTDNRFILDEDRFMAEVLSNDGYITFVSDRFPPAQDLWNAHHPSAGQASPER